MPQRFVLPCVTRVPAFLQRRSPHLFDRFYRAEADRSRETGGAGLGLAIAYEIARRHGGRIDVQSRPGEGTTFTVFLPLYQPGCSA